MAPTWNAAGGFFVDGQRGRTQDGWTAGARSRGMCGGAPAGRIPLQVSPEKTDKITWVAQDSKSELEEDLTVLASSGPLTREEHERLAEHGRRVRRHAGNFP
jgi:hypothetical protein